MSLACKANTSTPAACGINEACMSEIVGDLHQMGARNILVTGHVGYRSALIAYVRKSDQQT
ncbi:hypothetical protein SAMN06295987_10921 [Novosphingobium mathurense]|uniref:Uncharacterized protein n=1 Tax=Novosphingobium mathurense TaxID=428990 RepID=A0A1U6ILJ3_9SPHN|nr:hypothetical protein SAMN06295987_10921 [Novosphingobium mathurense]